MRQAARDISEEVIPVNTIASDPWLLFNDKLLLVDIIGDRTWRERDKAINNSEVSEYPEFREANTIMPRMAQSMTTSQ